MAKLPYQTLVDYFASMVASEPTEVVAFHRSMTGKPLFQRPWNDDDVPGMGKMVWDICKADADMRGGRQVYQISIANEHISLGQVPLTVITNLDVADPLGQDESAYAAIITSFIKTEEGRLRAFQDATNKLLEQQSKIIDRQGEMVAKMSERLLAQQEAFEKAQSLAAEREILRQESEASGKRKDEMLKMLLDHGPKIVAAKYGIDISSATDTVKDIALKQTQDKLRKIFDFMQGFSEEQRHAFLGKLTEQQLDAYLELMGQK